jgi:hypothetical protein
MRKEELKEIADVIWGVAQKVGIGNNLQFVTSKIVTPVPVPYAFRKVIKDEVEFEERPSRVIKNDSDDIPLNVLSLKDGIKALVGFRYELVNIFNVEIVEDLGTDKKGQHFFRYNMWDFEANPEVEFIKYDNPLHITVIATGLWVLKNLNSGDVSIDPVSGSQEKVEEMLWRIAPELQYIKKFEIR